MSKRDHYEVLGVGKSASKDDIKKAYRKLASKHHPDKNPGDDKAKERFQEIQSAYDTLSDDQKKAHYDQFGHEGPQQHGRDPFSHFHQHFHQNFNQPEVGDTLLARTEITLQEAALGTKKEVCYARADKCNTCDGTGAKPGTDIDTCGTCNGSGIVSVRQGPMVMQMTCPHCQGQGKTIKDPCSDCHGQGVTRINETVEITIPAGIDHGQQLRVANKGSYGPGGYGHLVVQVIVKPHQTIERDGNTLRMTISIPFTTAILGGAEIVTPLIGDDISVRIPPGTQPGQVLRVAGKGIKTLQHKLEGDLMVTIRVTIPKDLTHDQKDLIQKYADLVSTK